MASFLQWPRTNGEFVAFSKRWGLTPSVAIRALALGYYTTWYTGRRLIITSGKRSESKQKALRASYRHGTQDIRPAVHSCHTIGRAFDCTYSDGDYPDSLVGRLGTRLGLRWGAPFGDPVHFDLGGPCE